MHIAKQYAANSKRGVSNKAGRMLLAAALSAMLAASPSGLSAFATPNASTAAGTGIDAGTGLDVYETGAHDDASLESVHAGDFLVAGGVKGVDWLHDGSILRIMSSTPITVANADPNKATTQTIQVDAGVKADLTLAGVNIVCSTRAPLNIVTNIYDIPDNDGKPEPEWHKAAYADEIRNKTMLHLTLADGSVNYLINSNDSETQGGAPGIRCGWGSVLVVDDSIANIRAGGSKLDLDDIVTPEGGTVPYDARLLGGKAIRKGEQLSAMETGGTPGVLKAQGGAHAASIGSGQREDAGTMVFNGGNVEAMKPLGWTSAGIGAGYGGSGTRMVFNGGVVKATAGGCAAAIGCGYGSNFSRATGSPLTDAIAIPYGASDSNPYTYRTVVTRDMVTQYANCVGIDCYINVAGDIYVNGGNIYAEGAGHGNAIGQSCLNGTATNRSHVIRITGGSVTTYTPPNLSGYLPVCDIGARFGYTIVTGGSVYFDQSKAATQNNGRFNFEGIGDTAYNTQGIGSWEDVRQYPDSTLPDTDKVHAVGVDFSGEGITDNEIADWRLYVSGMPYAYGAPDHFQDGKLYLWLPESAVAKEIAVELSYMDDDGAVREVDRLFGTPSVTGGTLKRYAGIVVPDGYARSLSKTYDGRPIAQYGFIDPLPTSEAGVELVDKAKLTYKYQYFDKVDGTPLSEEVAVAGASAMPKDAGTVKLTLESTEYSDDDRYSTSYWGHRGTTWLEIKPLELGAASLGLTLGGEAVGGNGVVPAGAAGLSFGLSVDGSKLLEGDSPDGLLNDFIVGCVDANGDPIDCADPKPGIYTATLGPNTNGVVRDDGTVVSGGYAVKTDPVTFVVAGADADVVEGVAVRVGTSNGPGSGSGDNASILDAEDIYNLVASNPESRLPEAYDPTRTDVVITLDGVPVDAIDASRPGTYDIVILNKADGGDPDARDTVVHSELKVTSSRPSGSMGGGTGGADGPEADGSDVTFAPIDASTDIRLDPSATGTVGGDPYLEYEAGKPVNILDMIQVRPEGADGWSDWMVGTGSGDPDGPNGPDTGNPGGPDDPANPGGSDSPDNPNNPNNPDGSGSGDGSGTGPDGQAPQLPDNVKVVVTDEAGNQVDPANVTDPGTYEVTVSVKDPDTDGYIIIETLTFHVVDTSIIDTDYIYKDVAKDHWGHGYIFDIGPVVINGAFNPSDVALGYMAGYAGTTDFGPENGIIRGDAAIVIWRMAGCPDVEDQDVQQLLSLANTYYTGFTDCDADPTAYWNQAIAWCAANGIVTGYEGTGEYRPQNKITREEFASIIARYASFKGKDVASADADLTRYPDHECISDWAIDNIKYVTQSGIMTGRGTDEGTADGTHGILDPQADVTRAEVAKMTYMEQPMRLQP